MKEKEFSVLDFLERSHIGLSEYNFEKDLESYINEMQQGLDSKSTLPMLPTYIEDSGSVPSNVPVLVLDAGGTNFRGAIVTFSDENKAEISKFRKRGMPGVDVEHSREEFFDAIAGFIADLAVEVERIGFCFSYPMIKTADKDGRLTAFSKEIKAPEVEGELIGRGVLDALEKRGITNIKKIVLLNDTVATLLAGKAAGKPGEFDGYIGLILGTGVNASYNERNENIGKVKPLSGSDSQLINMEAGSCGILASGSVDLRFRNTTANSEAYKFEKMVSGGYLGQLWFTMLQSAADEGCFSQSFTKALEAAVLSGLSSEYDASALSSFLADKILPEAIASAASEADVENAFELSSALTKRSAYLVSVMVAGIVTKTGKGKSSDKPVCICTDGTTYWKLCGLKEAINENLKKYFDSKGIHYKIVKIDNAPVIGAAVAGLTNG